MADWYLAAASLSSCLRSSSWRSPTSGSYYIRAVSNGMDSMMSLTTVFNGSVGSSEVLVVAGVGVFLVT